MVKPRGRGTLRMDFQQPKLILIRGVSGAGKTTLAKMLGGELFEADQYFEFESGYHFNPSKLHLAHKTCLENCEAAMFNFVQQIVVSNTFTTQKELRPYLELAKEHDYSITVLVVENYHGNKDIHNVPQEKRELQAQKLKDNLRLI